MRLFYTGFVVGYTKSDLRTDDASYQVYTLCAVPFTGVDGGNVPVSSLQFAGVCKGEGPQDCDFIQIWNGEGDFNAYYCWADDGLWYNVDGEAPLTDDYPDGIPAGTPFWYVAEKNGEREGSAAATVSGAVDMTASTTYDLRIDDASYQVYTLLSNPYPTSWTIADGDCEITGVCKGEGPQDCDFLQIWNGEGDFNAYYCWADDGLWYNVDGEAPLTDDYPDGIPANTPFWFVAERDGEREGDAKITFNNPLAK